MAYSTKLEPISRKILDRDRAAGAANALICARAGQEEKGGIGKINSTPALV